MPVHSILAGAAVLGLAVVAPVAIEWAGARIEAGRQARADYAAILARIEEPRMTAEEMDAALAALRAEAAAQLQASDRRLTMTMDRWGGVHYATEPIAPALTSVLHLVDTQPHSAATATRPMLPTVKGELRRARLYDIGRAS